MATRPPRTRPNVRRRQSAILFAVVAVLAAPVVLDADDFPLSTYPMYSSARRSNVSFVTAVARRPDGQIDRLSLEVIGASDDPLIVAGELRAAIRADQAPERCDDIARRFRSSRDGVDDRGWTVEVVTERHDVVAFVAATDSLLDRTVHASCDLVGDS